MMRNDIYYWKCDSPHSLEEKRQSYFKEKYDRPELAGIVQRACHDVLGDPAPSVAPLRADGNHVAFIVTHGDRRYFFRADDVTGDDDYMLAESALMQKAAAQGIPVPAVYHTDVTRRRCPFRFQLMVECVVTGKMRCTTRQTLAILVADYRLFRSACRCQGRFLKSKRVTKRNS